MRHAKIVLQVLAAARMLLIALLLSLSCAQFAHAQDLGATDSTDNTALVETAPGATDLAPAATSPSPSFLGAVETTLTTWRSWMRAQSPYLVAVGGALLAYVTGFGVFYLAFMLGSYAPLAARSGFWMFAMITFVILAAIFMPLTAPWWWWLAAFAVLVVVLTFMMPKPRAA